MGEGLGFFFKMFFLSSCSLLSVCLLSSVKGKN